MKVNTFSNKSELSKRTNYRLPTKTGNRSKTKTYFKLLNGLKNIGVFFLNLFWTPQRPNPGNKKIVKTE